MKVMPMSQLSKIRSSIQSGSSMEQTCISIRGPSSNRSMAQIVDALPLLPHDAGFRFFVCE